MAHDLRHAGAVVLVEEVGILAEMLLGLVLGVVGVGVGGRKAVAGRGGIKKERWGCVMCCSSWRGSVATELVEEARGDGVKILLWGTMGWALPFCCLTVIRLFCSIRNVYTTCVLFLL